MVSAGGAPSARGGFISPACAKTSERKRFNTSPLVFMALAMIMLATGISVVMAVSITPAQVMMGVTSPAPAAIEQIDTLRAPGIFLARRAEIDPAVSTMAASSRTLVQRGPF